MKSCSLLLSTLVVGLSSASSLSKNNRPLAHHSTRMSPRESQFLNCYDNTNSGGDAIAATDYIDDLRNYNMDNRISSCCFQGIWILYEDTNYNKNNLGGMNWWAFGDNYCSNVPPQFDNAASSLRFTGAPDDMRYDTLNMYFNDYFIGDEEFTYDDKPALNYDNRAKSIVVTGCNPWTLYEYDNYQGQAVCVFPSDTTKCDPGLYKDSQSLGYLAGKVSSVKRGCYANTKLLPNNHGTRSQENGASGFF